MAFIRKLALRSLPLVALCVFAPAGAAPAAAPGFTYVKSLGGIDEYRLDANGLSVLIMPDHSAPLVSFQVVYRVGSRNEVTGTTGATHLLEHMMFKGTEAHNREKGNGIEQMLEAVGANYNATTSPDRTSYFGILGRDHLESYIALEADRMRNLRLRDADRLNEMTVVRNEYERGENDPMGALDKEVTAAAFQAQPYHHSTIGWRSDIENVPIEKLRQFYDTFYWPNNATVTVTGDFDPAKALATIKKYYGGIPSSPQAIPNPYTEEPPQTGPRRVMIKRDGELGAVMIGYKMPNGLHGDSPALRVLSNILTLGPNSRLSRALVESSLVSMVQADARPTRDPGLFTIMAGLTAQARHEQVEKVILQELEKIKANGVTADEVARVLARYAAQKAFERDGVFGTALGLAETVAVGDWTQFVTSRDQLAKVTPADVQRVAKAYLDEDRSTTGWFVPKSANALPGLPPGAMPAGALPAGARPALPMPGGAPPAAAAAPPGEAGTPVAPAGARRALPLPAGRLPPGALPGGEPPPPADADKAPPAQGSGAQK